jgi:hypothetical protein
MKFASKVPVATQKSAKLKSTGTRPARLDGVEVSE